VQYGNLKEAKQKDKLLLESNLFRVVLLKEWKGNKKQFL
jgi:hypothetical protein